MTVHATSSVSSPRVRSRTWRNWLFQCLIYRVVCCHSSSERGAARTPLSARFIFVSLQSFYFLYWPRTKWRIARLYCASVLNLWHWINRLWLYLKDFSESSIMLMSGFFILSSDLPLRWVFMNFYEALCFSDSHKYLLTNLAFGEITNRERIIANLIGRSPRALFRDWPSTSRY